MCQLWKLFNLEPNPHIEIDYTNQAGKSVLSNSTKNPSMNENTNNWSVINFFNDTGQMWQLNYLFMPYQKCISMHYMLLKHCLFSNFIKLSYSVKYIFSFPNIASVHHNSLCNSLFCSSTIQYPLIFSKIEGLLLHLWQLQNGAENWKKQQPSYVFPVVSRVLQKQLDT